MRTGVSHRPDSQADQDGRSGNALAPPLEVGEDLAGTRSSSQAGAGPIGRRAWPAGQAEVAQHRLGGHRVRCLVARLEGEALQHPAR